MREGRRYASGAALLVVVAACESGGTTDGASGAGGSGATSGTGATSGSAAGGTSGRAASGGSMQTGGSAGTTGGSGSATGGSSGRGGKGGGAGTSGTTTGGSNATGGASGGTTGGSAQGGASGAGEAGSGNELSGTERCTGAGLVWKTANKTNYTSYPDPGSQECIEFNGCMWEGLFAACDDKRTEAWVSAHNIVAAFPDFGELELHDLCLKSGNELIVVTVLDTCGDSDCDGCCTENRGSADELIDIESYTNERWGVEDGPIEWADLGPTSGGGCD
jgi:hypothetical protein